MPYTRPSAAAAAAEPPQYVFVPGHGTGKQIKAYHVAANPNRRQTKEHEPTGWPRGAGQPSSNAKKKKKKENKGQAEGSSGAGRGRKKILSIDYQSTFGRRNKKQKQKLMPSQRQAVLHNTRRRSSRGK